MNFERWSSGRVVLLVAAWLVFSPMLLFGVTRAMGGDLGFSLLRLLLLAVLWLGPPVWLVARWRTPADRERRN
jgi:hypothetical protein